MSYTGADRLYIWLSIAFEGRARTACELIQHYNNDLGALHEDAVKGCLETKIQLKRDALQKLAGCASDAFIDDFISNFEKRGVYVITLDSADYPQLLRHIDDPPLALYCRGKRFDNELCKLPFAIVGTRHCTEYGERVAISFGKALAEYGMTIVSGLAYGCDALAAKGALMAENNPLPTVAILGQGVCLDKHDYTQLLMERILEAGVVISEMLPFSHPTKGSFPIRNRIISGMSAGVLVVEAGERSGTSITANSALDQGRQVFAVPGRITDRMSAGTNRMIQQSLAQPVFGVEDVLYSFGIEPVDTSKQNGGDEAKLLSALDETGKLLYEAIQHGEKNVDQLVEISDLPITVLNLYLTDMEISGLIKQLPGRVYVVN